MKRFLKNNMLLILSLALVFAVVGSTYAYLVATDSQILNTFKLAQIDTKITEVTGAAGYKAVTIQNEDISSVYVRARVLVSGGDVGVPDAKIQFVTSTDQALAPDGINVVYNSTDWHYDGEWFYYLHVLPGKTGNTAPETQQLIEWVLVGGEVKPPENKPNASFEVDVYEESVLTSDTSATVAAGTVAAAFANQA